MYIAPTIREWNGYVAIDEAITPERDERLSAERAYELYWADLLGADATFLCVGEGCEAHLICACLEKPEQNLRIRPYFRSRRLEDHAATCEVVHARGGEKEENQPDVFDAQRPADHFRAAPSVTAPASASHGGPATRRTSGVTGTAKRASHYYRLSSLVQKFLEHRRDDDLDEASVEIGGETTTYAALFRNVYRQKVAELTGTRAVWWGKASIRATKDGGYFLTFSRPFRHDDTELRPTITLAAKDIEAYAVRRLLKARLDKLIDEGGRCVVFAWAKPWMPTNAESAFVRFYVNNLDHIDVRGTEVLDELKNTSRVAR